jgi:hypothetical protein
MSEKLSFKAVAEGENVNGVMEAGVGPKKGGSPAHAGRSKTP